MNNISGYYQTKIKSLESKINLYKKQIKILEDKISFYEKDNILKTSKINELIAQLKCSESEIEKLKSSNENFKDEKDKVINMAETNHKDSQEQIENLKNTIVQLKKDNKQLVENLIQKTNENQQYSQDNTILYTKIREIENSFEQQKNETMQFEEDRKVLEDYERQVEMEKRKEKERKFDEELSEYTSIILNELNYISKYIDTYLGENYDAKDMNIQNIFSYTNFPKGFILNFDFLKNAVANAHQRQTNEHNKSEKYINGLRSEIGHYNNIIKQKIKEISEIKNLNKEYKEQIFLLNNQVECLKGNDDMHRTSLAQIEGTLSSLNKNNDEYFNSIYRVIENELSKLLNEKCFESYKEIIYDNSQFNQIFQGSNAKFKFEEILDKLIMCYNCLMEDLKQIITNEDKVNAGENISNRFEFSTSGMNELDSYYDNKINQIKQNILDFTSNQAE